MQHSEATFNGAHGANIFYQYWEPASEPRAVILIAHGAAEHGGRYDIFAGHFTALGYVVAALDHYGHGRSDGGRCRLHSMQENMHNLLQFQHRMKTAFPQLPQVLLGHSMGGLIACYTLLQQQDRFAACVLSGPAIKTELTPPPWQLFFLRLVSRLAPNLGVIQLDAGGVSRDPAEVQRYVNDPLNHGGKMSARMVMEMFRTMDTVQAQAADIRLPMLILHGGDDPMTAPAGSQFLHDNVSSADKALKIYPGLYHEIFNEPERLEVFGDIETWLESRI